MGSRRLGGNSRVLRKKKMRLSKKSASTSSLSNATTGVKRGAKLRLKKTSSKQSKTSLLASLRKERSQLIKRHAAERMVLKEHLRELESRRQRIRKGENAKLERRELGKYIRQLQEEQKLKHKTDMSSINQAIQQHTDEKENRKHKDGDWEDISDGDASDEISEEELQNMFAHLTT